MKTFTLTKRFLNPGLVVVLGLSFLALYASAHPYATCLTNQGGIVSFRLNENGASVAVIGNGGTLSNYLGILNRGLIVTNLTGLGMTGGVFKVVASKAGAGVPTLISDNANTNNHFEYPMGVCVNKRPASPYFGRIYVANARVGTTAGSARPCGDGIYMLNSDHTEAVGQGNTARTGGLDFATGSTSSPWRITVGEEDDMLYISDWSDAAGNVLRTDPNVSAGSGTPVLKPLASTTPPGNATVPVTSANTHGSIHDLVVFGRLDQGNLTVITSDEDLQADRDTTVLTELNSLWRHDITSWPLPWLELPVKIANSPTLGYAANLNGSARGANGYLYQIHYRSAGAQNCLCKWWTSPAPRFCTCPGMTA